MLSKMETHNLITTDTGRKTEIEITRECAINVLILALIQAEQQSNAFTEKITINVPLLGVKR